MTVLLICACIAPVLFILSQKLKGGPLATVGKTFASVCFVALGLHALANGSKSEAGFLMILGLLLGLCGDILLDVGFEPDGTPNARLFGGIAAFALEHVAVIVAVSQTAGFSVLRFLIVVAVSAVIGPGVCLIEKKAFGFKFGALFVPCAVYSLFLCSALIYYTVIAVTDIAFIPVAVGMGFFLVSDLILSAIYFGDKNRHSWIAVNLLTYYAGQILFALSVKSVF